MKSNPLLKWLLIPMGLLLVFVGIKLFSGERGAKPAPAGVASQLTPEEMKALGVEGDTPRDTVATLVAQVKQLRNELQTALNDNKNQKTENERMRARESAIDQRIQSALDGERGRLQQDREQLAGDRQQTQGLLQDLQRRLDGLSGESGQAEIRQIGPATVSATSLRLGTAAGSAARCEAQPVGTHRGAFPLMARIRAVLCLMLVPMVSGGCDSDATGRRPSRLRRTRPLRPCLLPGFGSVQPSADGYSGGPEEQHHDDRL